MALSPTPFHCHLCDKYFDNKEAQKDHETKSRQHFTLVQKQKAVSDNSDVKPAVSASSSTLSSTPTESGLIPSNRKRNTSSSDSDSMPTTNMKAALPLNDDDIDDDGNDDEDAPTIKYSDLIGGANDYLRPAAQSSRRVNDVKPIVSYSQSDSSIDDDSEIRNSDLAYFPRTTTMQPMLSETEVKPALVPYASSRPSSSAETTRRYDLKPGLGSTAPTVGSSSRPSVGSRTSAYPEPSTSSPSGLSSRPSVDVKPSFVPTNARGVKEDDDDDIVIESFTEPRLRGGHDVGTKFRRDDITDEMAYEGGSNSVTGATAGADGNVDISHDDVNRNDVDNHRADAMEDSDEDLIIEGETVNVGGGKEVQRCEYCDIRLSSKAHWERHKETPSHKANEQHRLNQSENPFQPKPRFQYGSLSEDDDNVESELVDPVIDIRHRISVNNFHCSLCDVDCMAVETYQTHIYGAKHKRKVFLTERERQKKSGARPVDPTQELENRLLDDPNDPHVGLQLIQEFNYSKTVRFNCHLCGIATLTRDNLSRHVKSSKHRKAYLKEYWPSYLDDNYKDEDRMLLDASKKVMRSLGRKAREQGLNRADGVLGEDLKLLIAQKKEVVRQGSFPWEMMDRISIRKLSREHLANGRDRTGKKRVKL